MRVTMNLSLKVFLVLTLPTMIIGCSGNMHQEHSSPSVHGSVSQGSSATLATLGLDPDAQIALNAVMREHLEAVHEIVEALAEENFQRAQAVTEKQLGFAKHREAMRRQMPQNFPPEYHDLAMAHHHAADDLSKAISSKQLPRILPALARTLKACVACHRVYKR